MGIRLFFMVAGSILAGIGLFSFLSNAFSAFGIYQTIAGIALTATLALFYWMGYGDGKNACYMNAKPGQPAPKAPGQQRREPRIQD